MRIPTATYRLQFNHQFGLRDAESIIDCLHRLGISDIYASPLFCATPKSMHGYDSTDPTRLNPELGTDADFQRLIETVHAHQMGWVQDIVPNHMAYSSHNPWLMDVLEYGPSSPFYRFFDIDWQHPDPELNGKVLAPFLGEPLENVIKDGELKITYDVNGFAVNYYDYHFPVRLASVAELVQEMPEKTLLPALPTFESFADREKILRLKVELYGLSLQNTDIHAAIEAFINHVHSDTALFNQLMSNQYYRLGFWQTAGEKINYRRFFYINGLISLNIQRPEVFEAVHAVAADWFRKGIITGLRIDHLDGLRYPGRYLRDLRRFFPDLYIVAEKILEKDETIPPQWPLQGTTGYDFANYASAVFCDHRHQAEFIQNYAKFIGYRPDYDQLLYEQKKKVISQHMRGDIDNLVRLLQQTSAFSDQPDDSDKLADALINLIAAFGVYRTYIADHAPGHREYLLMAVSQAKQNAPELDGVLQRVQELFLSPDVKQEDEEFKTRFRQVTGPAMAKGFEDTLLYIYYPLVSLNEVGSMPEVFGISVQQFHEFNLTRLQMPHTMNTTSTHDTKRGEDVRARINVLSEMPTHWFEKVFAWHNINQQYKTTVHGEPAPDCNDEYMIYQVMLGALPVEPANYDSFCERLKTYIVKSIREAKVHGAWVQPNEAYEQAAVNFIEKLFHSSGHNNFWRDFETVWRQVHEYGMIGSCAQALLKMTCPGIPDFYQGTECWDLNLVDPDNRRPVNYTNQIHLLDQLTEQVQNERSSFLEWLFEQRNAGLMKLFTIRQTLYVRKQLPALFAEGDYIPLSTEGSYGNHIISFARIWEANYVLVTVPRFFSTLTEPGRLPLGETVWRDTSISIPDLPDLNGRDIFTGKTLSLQHEMYVSEILEKFPISCICSSC